MSRILYTIIVLLSCQQFACGLNWRVTTVTELVQAVDDINQNKYTNSTITLIAGTYHLTAPLVIEGVSNITIFSKSNAAILKSNGGVLLTLDNVNNLVVSNIIFDGNYSGDTGILLNGSSNFNKIQSCKFRYFRDTGLSVIASSAFHSSSNAVTDCTFTENTNYHLYMSYSNDFNIINNRFYSSALRPDGCYLDHCSAGNFNLNIVENSLNGLVVSSGSHCNRFENNNISGSCRSAVVVGDINPIEDNRYNIFSGNIFHTSSRERFGNYSSVVFYKSQDLNFNNNQIYSYQDDVISKYSLDVSGGSQRSIVTGNIFHHSKMMDVYSIDSTDSVVTNNQILHWSYVGPADINNDGVVNLSDLNIFIQAWILN